MIAKGLTGTKQPVSTFPGTRTHTQTEKPLGNRAMGVYRDKPFPRTLTDEEKRVELFREQYRESIKNRIVPPAHALNSIKSRYPNQVEVLSSRPNSSVPLDPEEEHSQVLAELQRQLGISPKETLVQAPTHLIRIQDLVTDDEENEGFLGSGSGAVNVVPSRSIPESGAEVMGRKVPLGPSLRQLTNRCPLYGDCCGNDDVEEAGIPHPPYLRDQPRSHTPPA
ncbi:hypothetical protein DFH27DRAFT_555008 [Peziza echinospora]|nr:hypothetical protein DFH27DRAFT_555008 [Peziza echinospora]